MIDLYFKAFKVGLCVFELLHLGFKLLLYLDWAETGVFLLWNFWLLLIDRFTNQIVHFFLDMSQALAVKFLRLIDSDPYFLYCMLEQDVSRLHVLLK